MVYLLNNISIFIWAFCIKHIKCKNKNSIFLFICFAQLTLIVGLRNEVGADYYSYLRIYNHLSGIWQYNYRYPEVEIGYELVNIIFGYFGIPYWGINLFMAFWTNLFIVLAIKEYKINICMSIFMYISLFFFYHSMNQTRQGLAMAIGIYAISQLCKKRNMAFVFWILFAMCFHTVAIVYLPLYLLRKIKITKKVLMLYLLGTIIVLVGYQFVVILLTYTKYGVYFNSYYDRSNALSTIINLVVRIVMLFLALFYAKKIKEGMSKNILYHMVIICTCVQAITIQSSVFGRITTPFFISYIILIPTIISSISQKKRSIMTVLAYVAASFYQGVYYSLMKTAVLVNDYKSVFDL